MNWFKVFHRDEAAATAVEYAVMLGLILMAVFATVVSVGQALSAKYTYIDAQINAH